MINTNDMPNEAGVCPFCKETTLEYDSIRAEGTMVYYPWKCSTCGHKGEEWYDLTFSGHNIEDENGDINITLEGGE